MVISHDLVTPMSILSCQKKIMTLPKDLPMVLEGEKIYIRRRRSSS